MSLFRHTITLEVRDWNPVALAALPKAYLWEPYTFTPPVEERRQDSDRVLRRLTSGERQALFQARSATWEIDYFITRASITGIISEADEDFSAAVAVLNQRNIIQSARWTDLLAP